MLAVRIHALEGLVTAGYVHQRECPITWGAGLLVLVSAVGRARSLRPGRLAVKNAAGISVCRPGAGAGCPS